MAADTILLDRTDGIATITLNRPDRLNAFNVAMMRDLIAAFDEIDADDDVRAVVVTGAGRAFCAGADLAAGSESFDYDELASRSGDSPPRTRRDGGGLLTLRIFRCTKPVIAAINGHAVGVGATMTLPMDVRFAADTSRFGFVFAARGIVPEACSSWFLPRVVGISRAAEWMYTGRVFDAAEALEGGLVRSLHPAADVVEAATALAREIAVNAAPLSVALSRMMLWRGLTMTHPMEAHWVESRAVRHTGALADAREGITAFFEKRPADWSLSPTADLPEWVPWWDEPEF